MQLKKELVLRKVLGEYYVVPVGRLSKISPMMQITPSAAWLWEVMENGEFTEDSLVEAATAHYTGVEEACVRSDIQGFLKLLDGNYMLDSGRPEPITGMTEIKLTKKMAEALGMGQKKNDAKKSVWNDKDGGVAKKGVR